MSLVHITRAALEILGIHEFSVKEVEGGFIILDNSDYEVKWQDRYSEIQERAEELEREEDG